jgi:Tol biopolymer transport system component
LAKIADPAVPQGNPVVSPTLTVRAATQAGLILGTAAYMAPEQARGQTVDRRADIWSFGAVLFEMLSGKMPFQGDNVTDILASVVKLEPEWSDLPPSTPPAIRKLAARCLTKDRKRRLQAIGEARLTIEDYLANPAGGIEQVTVEKSPKRQTPARWWIALTSLLFIGFAWISTIHFRETPPPERVIRFLIPAPPRSNIYTFAISPDGRYVVFAAGVDGKRKLFLQPLDTVVPQELRGTEDALYPFWSPDSRFIGFFASGKLKRTGVDGAPPQILCDAPDGRGGTWSPDGVIVFAPSNVGGLQKVAAVGGVPSPVTQGSEGEIQRFPAFLSGGRKFLYLVNARREELSGIYAASLDGLPARKVLSEKSSAVWIPPRGQERHGSLLLQRQGTLMAQPFDDQALQPVGDMFPVADRVSVVNLNYAQASVSSDGVLVYWSGGLNYDNSQLTWYDRSGKQLGTVGPAEVIAELALSPDEKTVAVARGLLGQNDIWLRDLARGLDTRFTFERQLTRNPVWSPDGTRIAFYSSYESEAEIKIKEVSGSEAKTLFNPGLSAAVNDWSNDGRFLLYSALDVKNRRDLRTVSLEGTPNVVPFLETPFNEHQGRFSPNGKWVAYTSDESGRPEIYVRPFPPGSGKWKISVDGGELPQWNRDGKELFFLTLDRKLMSASLRVAAGSFSSETPRVLFEGRISHRVSGFGSLLYAVAANGARFLVSSRVGEPVETPLTVVLNWQAATKR